MSSRLDQLERLVQLKDAGALTAEEFEAEKAKVLAAKGADQPPQPAPKPVSPQTESTSDTSVDDGGGDDTSWNPIKRPADVAMAERLSRFGLLAGALMVANDVAILFDLLLKSVTGATYDGGMTYASALPFIGGVILVVLAIDVGLTVASWRGRSRWAAVGLLIMAGIAVFGTGLELTDGRTFWRLLQFVTSFAAFFFAIQAIRGAFWLKTMGGRAELQRQRTESEREMGRVFDTYMPAAARRRWLMIVGAVTAVTVAVGLGSSLLDRQGEPEVETGMPGLVQTSPEVAMPAGSPTTDPAPILGLPPLVSGLPFAQARQQILEAGLSPMPINLNGECPGGLCQAYPEVIECTGMGSSADDALYAPCTLRYRRAADGAWIIVRTTGEYLPDYNQDVEFHDMAVMNAQDRGTVTEIESQYASLPPQ